MQSKTWSLPDDLGELTALVIPWCKRVSRKLKGCIIRSTIDLFLAEMSLMVFR